MYIFSGIPSKNHLSFFQYFYLDISNLGFLIRPRRYSTLTFYILYKSQARFCLEYDSHLWKRAVTPATLVAIQKQPMKLREDSAFCFLIPWPRVESFLFFFSICFNETKTIYPPPTYRHIYMKYAIFKHQKPSCWNSNKRNSILGTGIIHTMLHHYYP